jgi:hypothetical protein
VELIRTYKHLGLANNDECYCNVCHRHKETEEWHNRHKARMEEGHGTRRDNNVLRINRASIFNNLFSKHATTCHLNQYYTEKDCAAHEIEEEYSDEDDRGVPPRKYIWGQSQGKFATKISIDDNTKILGYEQYSNLLVLIMGVNNRLCRILLDTGSEVDILSEDWVEKFKEWLTLVDTDMVLQLADDDMIATVNKKATKVRLDLYPKSSSKKHSTHVDMLVMKTGNDNFDGIIGIKTMAKLGIRVQIPKFSEAAAAAAKEDAEHISRGYVHLNTNAEDNNNQLTNTLADLINANQLIKKSQWTTMDNGVINFELTEEQLRNAYRTNTNYVSLAFFEAVDSQVQEWLDEEVIEINNENTPINLPLLAIKQNNTDGSLRKIRVCVDFRQLNKLLSMDSYSIPKFNELHSMFIQCEYFTVIDLEAGYNQVMVDKSCRKYMCFRWKGTQYRFRGSPFGLHFLPSQFNRMVSHHLRGIPGVIVYIDDIIIASRTYEEHVSAVSEVLRRLTQACMRINKAKCMFGCKEVNYLGFKLSRNGIRVDPDRTKRLVEMTIPTTGKELLSFLCMANYIRQHIPEFGLIAAPLYEISSRLGRKKLSTDQKWHVEGLPAWEQLQQILKSPLVLKYPDPGLPFILRTDACTTGYGGYLFQQREDGTENIIHIFSGTFKKAQMAYSIPKKELFAIIYAFRNLTFYLRGAKFLLQTDAMCLSELHYKQIDCETMAKWALILSEYDYNVEHIPGELNLFADLLSRQNEDCTMEAWTRLKSDYYNELVVTGETNRIHAGVNVVKLSKRLHDDRLDEIDSYPVSIKQKIRLYSLGNNNTMTGTKIPFNADTFTNDWMLNKKYFNMADQKWGPHTIDLFAAAHNAQTDRFITASINAFTLKWKHENAWANPPWHLIDNVLRRVKVEQATITICVPYYLKATWWNNFKSMLVDDPIIIGKSDDIFLRNGAEQVGTTPWELTLIARISGKGNSPQVNLSQIIDTYLNNRFRVEEGRRLADAAVKLAELTRLNVYAAEADHSDAHRGGTNVPSLSPIYEMRQPDMLQTTNAVMTRSSTRTSSPIATSDFAIRSPHLEVTTARNEDEALREGSSDSVFRNVEDRGALYSPVAIGKGAEKLSWVNKYDIVLKYHLLGHQQTETVVNLVRNTGKYDWPELRELAEQIDFDCHDCEVKRIERKGYHPLRSLKSRHAGDIWIIDLIQLPKKYDVNNESVYVLHVLDHWSGYSWFRALPNKEAKTITHHLIMIMMDNGCPKEFRHDGGGEFGKETKFAIELIAASHRVVGIPYHAQSQGANERKHGDLKDVIIQLLNEECGQTRDWKTVLPFAQMKVNLQVSRKHGSTPFAVYFGRTHNIFNVNEKFSTALEWIDAVTRYDNLIVPALNDRIDRYHEAQELAFLKAHEAEVRDYSLHDLVKVRVFGEVGQGPQDALTYQWKGPFRIVGRVKGGYNIGYVHPRAGQEQAILNEHTVPPEQLSPWRRAIKLERYSEEWTALKVLNHKVMDDGKRYYRIKWEGNWTPTWEAAHNISTALKDTYWKTIGKECTPLLIDDNGQPDELVIPDELLQDTQVALHRFNRLSSSENIVFRDLLNKEQIGCQEMIYEEISSSSKRRPRRRVNKKRALVTKKAFAMRLTQNRKTKGINLRLSTKNSILSKSI